MDATQAVIHFIGLVLFSTQVANDPGLHAILPTIQHTVSNPDPTDHQNHQMQFSLARRSPAHATPAGPAPAAVPANIEPHMSLLIFHKDLVPNNAPQQWNPSTILSKWPNATALTDYRYVELAGEHITFLVDAPNNPPATLPTNMPKFSCPNTTAPGLTPDYQWPYSKAAAVVDIPEGALSVCRVTKVADGRIDTRLVLNTGGTLTVYAQKAGVIKTLVLKTTGTPTIYVANVPPPRVDLTDKPNGDAHYYAYFKMIGKDKSSNCSGAPGVPPNTPYVADCKEEPVFIPPSPTGTGTGTSTTFNSRFVAISRRAVALGGPAASSQKQDPVLELMTANPECSNTQWP